MFAMLSGIFPSYPIFDEVLFSTLTAFNLELSASYNMYLAPRLGTTEVPATLWFREAVVSLIRKEREPMLLARKPRFYQEL